LVGLFVLMGAAGARGQYVFAGQGARWVHTLHFAEDGAISAIHGLISPQAWYHEGRTYVAYQGDMNAPRVTYYEHEGEYRGQWGPIVTAGENPLGDGDTHGAPSMVVDKHGYIYVFFGSHGGKQIYKRSKQPKDISEWVSMPPVSGGMTYPCSSLLADNSIVLVGRSGAHVSPWVERVGTDLGKTWGPTRSIADFRPNGIYGTVKPGVDGKTMHFTFSITQRVNIQGRATTDPELGWKAGKWWTCIADGRHDCYYMWRDLQGKWYNIEGEELTLPVTLEMARQKCKVWQKAWPHHGQHGTMGIDENDKPCIVFLDGVTPRTGRIGMRTR